jgi:hypothetical protein
MPVSGQLNKGVVYKDDVGFASPTRTPHTSAVVLVITARPRPCAYTNTKYGIMEDGRPWCGCSLLNDAAENYHGTSRYTSPDYAWCAYVAVQELSPEG